MLKLHVIPLAGLFNSFFRDHFVKFRNKNVSFHVMSLHEKDLKTVNLKICRGRKKPAHFFLGKVMTNPKPFRLLVVWQLQPLAISSHIWLVAKQWPFNVFSLVFMVLSSKWIIWQMLKLTLAINTFRSLWKDMFSSSKYVKFPSHQHPKRFLWKFSGVSFKLNYCRMHPLELFKNRCYFQC